MLVYAHTHTYTHAHTYTERERERQTDRRDICICKNAYTDRDTMDERLIENVFVSCVCYANNAMNMDVFATRSLARSRSRSQ